jgi:transposase-like protein
MVLPPERIRDLFTRIDELLEILIRVEEEQLRLLRLISERVGPPVAPPVAPPVPPVPPPLRERIIERYERGISITEIAREFGVLESTVREIVERIVPPPPGVTVVALRTESIIELARELAKRILQLPNRGERIEWDTSETAWKSLRAEGKIKPDKALGFWVEDIGGGFEYKIVRETFESDAKTAEEDDKWDQEFDDLLVKGAGAGTALIWYWWRVE